MAPKAKAGLSPARKKQLRELFRNADQDSSGLLSFTEMSQVLREGNPSLTDKELAVLFREIDSNGDLTVDFKEFARYLNSQGANKLQKSKSREQVAAERCKEEFRKYDDNRDGKLSGEELCKLLQKGNPEIDQKELDLLFDTVDADGNGQLDFGEFADYITGVVSLPVGRLPTGIAPTEPELPSWSETVAVPTAYQSRKSTIAQGELRGITRPQLDELMVLVKEVLERCQLPDGSEPPKPLTLDVFNMYCLAAKFLKPLTAKFKCSFVEMVAAEPQEPQWFISHFWGTPLVQTQEMPKHHAAERKVKKLTPLWIDAFAVSMHEQEQVFPSPASLEKAPFCKALLHPRCAGTVLLLDRNGLALERTWCLLEVILTLDLPNDKGVFHALDVAAYSQESEEGGKGQKVSLLEDAGTHFEEVGCFPSSLYIKGFKVAVQKSEAGLDENRKRILHFLASTPTDRWDKVKPPAECPLYDQVNTRIQRRFIPGALAVAGKLDDDKTLRKLLSDHADFKESTTAKGLRPLHVAAWHNATAALKVLIGAKCELDAPSTDGETPLHVAAGQGSDAAVQLLLKANADMNAMAIDQTPLHTSIEASQITITGTLLDWKADPNANVAGGFTPLQLAASRDQAAMCGLLLDFKADPLRELNGKSIPELAQPKSKLQATLQQAADQAKAGLRKTRRPSVHEAHMVKHLSTFCSDSVKGFKEK